MTTKEAASCCAQMSEIWCYAMCPQNSQEIKIEYIL